MSKCVWTRTDVDERLRRHPRVEKHGLASSEVNAYLRDHKRMLQGESNRGV